MKIVINKCYGGFSISPEAALWMYENGANYLATPIEKYAPDRVNEYLQEWREYLKNPNSTNKLFVTVITKDEKYVLDTRPSDRTDNLLIKCVEELGDKANGACAELSIVEIPDGIDYEINEYDGSEWVAERHRTWS